MASTRTRVSSKPIDSLLIKTIHACARENGVSREEIHEAIAHFGKTSLKDLTKTEAYRLLDGLRGGKPSPHFTPKPDRRHAQANHGRRDYDASADAIYPVTDRERELLREAADLRKWDDATLSRFVERQTGKAVVVTMADFNRVFWPLKAMNRRNRLHQ